MERSEKTAALSGLEQVSAVVHNPQGASEIILVCEHASHYIPAVFGNLGLSDAERLSHIGWDPGAAATAKKLSRLLGAPLVLQQYSRLLYDCNRPPDVLSAIPQRSEYTEIPGNIALSSAERDYRIKQIYDPFHAAIDGLIRERVAADKPYIIVTIHSFTPVFMGVPRTVELGVIYAPENRFAERFYQRSKAMSPRNIRNNEPYGPSDPVLHTIGRHSSPKHGALMLEIRNDLLSSDADQQYWAGFIAKALHATINEEK